MSCSPTLSQRFSPEAISPSADIGSPCEPVEMMHTCSGARRSTSSMSISGASGIVKAEVAGEAPFFDRHAERGHDPPAGDGGVGDLLDPVDVAGEAGGDDAAALVGEQRAQHRADLPLARRVPVLLRVGRVREQQPNSLGRRDGPMRARSVRRPSTGVRSTKSPEWSTTPCGVCTAMASTCGTECVTGMNSTSNGPMRRRSPSATTWNVVRSSRPASSMRLRARPRVSAEP